jgi:GntR family transcriptional regulator/MocR family aminotransferase
VHITLDGPGPLSRQIYQQIRDAVLHGRLAPGQRMPPSRELAADLQVARSTVSAAYDQLTGEGYLTGRPGVGTFVSSGTRPAPSIRSGPTPLQVSARWQRVAPTVPEFAAERPEYDFRTGIPDTVRFPYPSWRRLIDAATRQSADGAGLYADPAGVPAMRAAIARHLGVSRGLRADPADIVATNGVQQAVTLACQVMLDPGDVVAVEDPGYLPVRRALLAAGATVVDVPVDDDGLVVDALPDRARMVYVTPAHQFPLGVPMSLPRRLALLAWADRAGAAVLEDDYDTDFRYTGRPVDPLHALDRTGRVIYVGSFSKTMLPILRLGYCLPPPGLAESFRQARFVADWHGPVPAQLALAGFIDEGRLVAHIRSLRHDYQTRRDRIAEILDRAFGTELRRLRSVAGLHLSAHSLRADHDETAAWADRARQAGVAVRTLGDFSHRPDTRPGLMIGFGAIALEHIDEGLRRLRAAR